jgi:hypothetical protein
MRLLWLNGRLRTGFEFSDHSQHCRKKKNWVGRALLRTLARRSKSQRTVRESKEGTLVWFTGCLPSPWPSASHNDGLTKQYLVAKPVHVKCLRPPRRLPRSTAHARNDATTVGAYYQTKQSYTFDNAFLLNPGQNPRSTSIHVDSGCTRASPTSLFANSCHACRNHCIADKRSGPRSAGASAEFRMCVVPARVAY